MSEMMRHCARVSLEMTGPFLVGSGELDDFVDAMPVVDARDLPAIPGTSLAGILRHAYGTAFGETDTNSLFGGAGVDGNGSRLWVSWAHIHNKDDRPVDGPIPDEASLNDPVLLAARVSTIRDHVRINHLGTAADQGKFDEAIVCAGHRFTFDLMIEGGTSEEMDRVCRMLASPSLRIGRGGRRGYGAFRVARCLRGNFDLAHAAQAEFFCRLPVRLDTVAEGLHPVDVLSARASKLARLALRLEPEDCFSFAGGVPYLLPGEDASTKTPDINPVYDKRVVWTNGTGFVRQHECYAPGSSIKGALAHRTVFHYNRAAGVFMDKFACPSEAEQHVGEANEAVRGLFGSMKGRGGCGSEPGKIRIDDVWFGGASELGSKSKRIMHNTIDRFTGGTLTKHLFEERVFHSIPLDVTIEIEDPGTLSPAVLDAFRRSAEDLCEGRLQLGAGAGRGHGYFRLADNASFDALWAKALEGAR